MIARFSPLKVEPETVPVVAVWETPVPAGLFR